jgi:hypothetical protein
MKKKGEMKERGSVNGKDRDSKVDASRKAIGFGKLPSPHEDHGRGLPSPRTIRAVCWEIRAPAWI